MRHHTLRDYAVRQFPGSDCRLSKAVVWRALPLAVLAVFVAVASNAYAFQDPVTGYQPSAVPGHYQYAKRYYGAVSPYPVGFYSYPNYVYGGAIGGYSVGYYPYAFPPPYRAPLWPYAFGYYGYGGWPSYGAYPGWGWGFGF